MIFIFTGFCFFSVIFVVMGRLNILIFLVVLTISGFVTGDRIAMNETTACVCQHSFTYQPYVGLSKDTRPPAETHKTYKTRFTGSEIKFDPDIFRLIIHKQDLHPKPKHLQPFHFITDDCHITISLRGPPSVC